MREISSSENYILHFFPYEKFTMYTINFFNRNYGVEKNVFILYGNEENFVGNLEEILSFGNVIKGSELNRKNTLKLIRKAKKIIYHFFVLRSVFKLLLIRKKEIYTLFWGADLEELKFVNCKGIKGYIRRLLAKYCFRFIIPITIIENDFKVLTSELNINIKKHFVARYYSDLYEKQICKIPYKPKNDLPKILIGNSATITNNHKEVLDELKKFSNQNFEIYLPLSYGDKNYAMSIKKYAIECFGNKVHVLDTFMEPSEYNEFLNNMDIGIFNYYRQQGLGNINRLLLLQKKVYVNSKSGLFDYYINQGVKVYEINSLKDENYEEFINYSEDDYYRNRLIQTKSISNGTIVKEWDRIFSD